VRPENLEYSRGPLFIIVEVQVDVSDFLDVVFRSITGAVFQGIHANENVGTCTILICEPALKLWTGNCFGGGDALQRLAARAVAQQNRHVIRGLVQGKNVLGRGKRPGLPGLGSICTTTLREISDVGLDCPVGQLDACGSPKLWPIVKSVR
jgi:hypothetical protein